MLTTAPLWQSSVMRSLLATIKCMHVGCLLELTKKNIKILYYFSNLYNILSLISQYTVLLQSEEHIPKECRQPSKSGSSSVTHTSHGSIQENCVSSKKTHIVLPIPMTSTPGFSSELSKYILCYKNFSTKWFFEKG